MPMHQFLISAAHKSSGKTTVSLGIAAALTARGLSVQPYKKGPDYIDPIWLTAATNHACRNLDFHLSSPEEITHDFATHGAQADVRLVEGNKGLYDGLDLTGSNSNAALAKLLGLPVVLVLDARGMTRGIAPLLLGYQAFDPEIKIAGVILNRLGGARHESKLRAVIEHYTDITVLGALQEQAELAIPERHLGLMPANESHAAAARIQAISAAVASHTDLERLLALTQMAEAPTRAAAAYGLPDSTAIKAPAAADSVKIGIAQDAAFGFYYADDLDAMKAAGATLVPFSPINDHELPDVDGLFIGGGFPECFIEELSANHAMRAAIARVIDAGMPVYAECGGLMYLARTINWAGHTRTMVGAIPGDITMHDKPVGRGYVRLAVTAEHPWMAGEKTCDASESTQSTLPAEIPAHEFHYSSLENLPTDTVFAYTVLRGHGTTGKLDGIVRGNLLAAYTHLRSAGNCHWAERFVQHVSKISRAQKTHATQSANAARPLAPNQTPITL